MLIANPLYDVVFKYLLEDMDIARGLLSAILGEEILSMEVKPQETATENTASNISILRFDFKAVVRSPSGESRKILIELQKAKQVLDVMRFRRYLGDNYRKEDEVLTEEGLPEKRPLPIVTIYILGFLLDNIQNAAIKVNREYRDAITNEIIEVKEEFIELLTHNSYVIQVLRLKARTRTKLERVLQIFSPEFRTKDQHQLDFQGDAQDPLVKKMVDRLGRAIASEDMRDQMDVEDEIERIFERGYSKLEKASAEKDKIIAEKEQALEAKEQVLEAKEQALAAERQKNEDLLRQIEELQKQAKK